MTQKQGRNVCLSAAYRYSTKYHTYDMHKTNPGKCIEIKCGLGYVCVGFYLFFAKLCCRRRALASPPSQQYKLLLLTLSYSLCGVSCCWVEFSYDKTSIDRAKYLEGQSLKFDLSS